MKVQAKHFYDFGPFRLDVEESLLLRDGESLTLPPKAFETLLALVENSGHLLNKEDLMKRLWPDTFVEEANLANNISLLRRVLGDDAQVRQYIETVPKRGYRFVASVRESSEESAGLMVRERTRAQFTIEEAAEEIDEQARSLPAPRRARSFRLPALIACALLAAAGYYFRPGRIVPPAPAAPPSVRSIAVLPFKPLVETSRDEVLEMGMADTLITRLSNIRQINVRPMSAVRKYANFGQDAAAAGLEQRVDAVLEGSIQRSGDDVRVTVRLVRVTDASVIWTGQFDEKFTNIFALQDAISERVAGALAVRLSGSERQWLTKHATENTEAYQLYLKGRYHFDKWEVDGFKKAFECFKKAIEIDSTYAPAYAGMADAYINLGAWSEMAVSQSHPQARTWAEKALEIDDQLPEAHTSLGIINAEYYWNWPKAEEHYKRAIELNPNYVLAHQFYAEFLSRMGRLEEGIAEARLAQHLDPISVGPSWDVALAYYHARQNENALAELHKSIELHPDSGLAYFLLGLIYARTEKYEEALSALQRARVLTGDLLDVVAVQGATYALAGKRSEALNCLRELQDRSKKRYVAPFLIGGIYSALGDKDKAIDYLERAYEDRNWFLMMLKVEPALDPLRSDPRFQDLLRRMNF